MHQTTAVFSLVAAGLASGCAGLPASDTGGELAVTGLCQLIANPGTHADTRVHIKSLARPAAHSVILLYDEECKDAFVVLDAPSSLDGTPGVEKMMKVVWEGYPAPRAGDATIELYGVYRWEEGEVPSRYVVAESVVVAARDAARTAASPTSGPEVLAITFKEGRPREGDGLLESVSDARFTEHALSRDLEIISRFPQLTFQVSGTTDNKECAPEACHDLSVSRARLVNNWLLSHGIQSSALKQPIGRGDQAPLTDNASEDARSANRRAVIDLVIDEERLPTAPSTAPPMPSPTPSAP